MSKVPTVFDVAVIGASVAGSAAAIRLGQAGLSVALIDKSEFPRSKACGEGFSCRGIEYLQSLGVNTALLLEDSAPFYGYRFVSSTRPYRTCVISTTSPRGWGVSRAKLDLALLVTAQKQPSIRSFLSHAIRTLTFEDGKWCISSDSNSSILARRVFVAAGVTCEGLAREYVATVATPSKRVGYTLHAELTSGTLPDLVTILPAVNGEVYVTRLGANLLNVSLVGTHDFIQVNRNPEFLASMLQAALTIRYQLSSGGYGSGHFQARRCSRHPDLYLLGDAAESFDPACGLGMTHALHSGIMTAEAVIKSLHLPDSISVSVLPGPAEWQSYARQIRRYSAVVRLMMRLVRVAPRLCGAINPKATAKLLHMFERLLLPAVSV